MTSYVQYIKDVLHGEIGLTKIEKQLLSHPIVNRLNHVIQLGLTDHVYPGGRHKRLEHSIGVMYLAESIMQHLMSEESVSVKKWKEKLFNFLRSLSPKTDDPHALEKDIINLMRTAGFLHDIGHLPSSHVFEKVLERKFYKKENLDISDFNKPPNIIILSFNFKKNSIITNIDFNIVSAFQEVRNNKKVYLQIDLRGSNNSAFFKHELFTWLLIKYFLKDIIEENFCFGKNTAALLLIILSLEFLKFFEINNNTLEFSRNVRISFPKKLDQNTKQNRLLRIIEFLSVIYPLHQIISSELDVDRLDYVQRDILMTGLNNGGYDLNRIISSFAIFPRNIRDHSQIEIVKILEPHKKEHTTLKYKQKLEINFYITGVKTRGLSAVTAYYYTRFEQYKWVIYHPVVMILDKLFEITTFKVINKIYENQEIMTNQEKFKQFLLEFVINKNVEKEVLQALFAGIDESGSYAPSLRLIDEKWFSFMKLFYSSFSVKNLDPLNEHFAYVTDWDLLMTSLFYRINLPIPLWRNPGEFNVLFEKETGELIDNLINYLINNVTYLSNNYVEPSDKKAVTYINTLLHLKQIINKNPRNEKLSQLYVQVRNQLSYHLLIYLLNIFFRETRKEDQKSSSNGKEKKKMSFAEEIKRKIEECPCWNNSAPLNEGSSSLPIIHNVLITTPASKYLKYLEHVYLINDFGEIYTLNQLSGLISGISKEKFDSPLFIVYLQVSPSSKYDSSSAHIDPSSSKQLFNVRHFVKSKRNKLTLCVISFLIQKIKEEILSKRLNLTF